MSNYTDDTFKPIWAFVGADMKSYCVLHNIITDTYHFYESADIEEVAYKNYAVIKDCSQLNGTFYDNAKYFYITTTNNTLHNEVGPSAFVPCGLDIFRPKEDVIHYAIHGKLMSQYSWLTWVKGTPSWPIAMANILGSKNPE